MGLQNPPWGSKRSTGSRPKTLLATQRTQLTNHRGNNKTLNYIFHIMYNINVSKLSLSRKLLLLHSHFTYMFLRKTHWSERLLSAKIY